MQTMTVNRITRGKCVLFLCMIFLLSWVLVLHAENRTEINPEIKRAPNGEMPLSLDQEALAVIYSGQEKMHFSISWSGGVKIGDLVLTLTPNPSGEGLMIKARVRDYGLFKLLYPVDDTFTTLVYGPLKLPSRYEVYQREGRRKIHRLTLYDQEKFQVSYRKHQDPLTLYSLAGPAYNEFSAFFITRALRLLKEEQQIIPSFVDKKRHRVAVKVFGKEQKETMFGPRNTIKVMPKMNFKGLYDKDGDTVFWLTDDACRIPVEIRSKILIGSLVAQLKEYSNPACQSIPTQNN
ncbi:MAG: DUF3108 domain-containing protein [Candidatus Electrothrix sp. Rat3]|nr:DUF3108 domain-containing protein [Candidatus Electrothrix rattekaaiensis]